MSQADASPIEVAFELNGEPVRLRVPAKRSTLDVLREDLGIWSCKPGCSPQGVCGCCAVLVDGKVRLSCTLPVRAVRGRSVTTLDGFPDTDRAIVAEAFTRAGGTQCGYCTPGIVVQALALLERNPDPTDEQIRKALGMHVCRCTGWVKVVDAIRLAGAMRRGEAPLSLETEEGGVGASLPRSDAHALVLGERPFIDDMVRPGMLHGALVWTPHARCRVVRIDASEALALPGVHAVVTARDVPGERRVGLIHRDWPVLVAEGEETRCAADILAAVAAETRELAYRARDLVRVEVEELPPVTDLEEAAADPARRLAVSRVRKGDYEAGAAEAHVLVRNRFRVQQMDQAFLEPEAALAVPTWGGGLHVYSCGQGVFDDHRQLCGLLAMPPDRLTVELVPTGGGFGAKEDLNVQSHAALLALQTGRPVKVSLTMEESTRYHPKRHAMILDYELAARRDGTLVALRARILGDTGGYASVGDKVLERAAGHAAGPYRIPNVDVEAVTVYTNNPVAGAMRGFGVNQVAFALEGCLDRLAEKLGIDPWELRYHNALRDGDAFGTGQRLGAGVGIRRTLEAVRPRYEAARAAGRHVGVACGVKNVGMGNGLAEVGRVELHVRSPDEVCIKTGFTEMGQGHDTVMRQFAAETTGLSYEVFTVECDTSVAVDVGMTTASRATYLGGNAMRVAGEALRAALERAGGDLAALQGRVFRGSWSAPATHAPGEGPDTHYAYGWATQLAILAEDGTLEEVVAAHDVGRAINPVLCEGQIEGAVHQGIGYALSEELRCTDGMPNTRFRDLGVIGARHTPRITVILVEEPDPVGPWGAKGVGEIGLVPTAPAIAAALRGYEGRWRDTLPMKDSAAALGVGVRPRRRVVRTPPPRGAA